MSGETFFRVPLYRRVFLEDADGRAATDLGFVDPMLKRRLSPLAKLTLSVAYECSKGVPDPRLVYASRHGEITRTLSMLEDLAHGEGVSPTVFSLSVLNATAGLFSLIFKNVEPTTAISSGRSSFGYGLLEAALRFAEAPSRPLLYVYSDEPLPGIYGEKHAREGASRVALAILLWEPAEGEVYCSTSSLNAPASDEAQARAFLRCFEHGCSDWSDGDKTWRWEKSEGGGEYTTAVGTRTDAT
ncbi:MAG: beta-ketoacyl synthase chain length factor [Candidatus Accumulibacter sp.]|jgi:hypothetical protein|nr:beta-ketoacyl synthase chain length factor [Accumulibacter sp.]